MATRWSVSRSRKYRSNPFHIQNFPDKSRLTHSPTMDINPNINPDPRISGFSGQSNPIRRWKGMFEHPIPEALHHPAPADVVCTTSDGRHVHDICHLIRANEYSSNSPYGLVPGLFTAQGRGWKGFLKGAKEKRTTDKQWWI